MSMNVIDISSYQGSLNLNNVNYDGVVIKATEGNGYVNPYCASSAGSFFLGY